MQKTTRAGDKTGVEDKLERVMGIEPTSSAWEAEVLPLNNTRNIGWNKSADHRPAPE